MQSKYGIQKASGGRNREMKTGRGGNTAYVQNEEIVLEMGLSMAGHS